MMNEKYIQLEGLVQKLNLRERAIVLAAAVLLVIGIWYLTWFSSVSSEHASKNSEHQSLIATERDLQQQIEILSQASAGNIFQEQQRQLTILNQEQKELDDELAELSQGLVSAQKLSQLLQDVLKKAEAIELLRLTTLPVKLQSLTDSREGGEEEKGNTQTEGKVAMGVYQHGVSILVRGEYAEIVNLLEELESLQWRFYWGSLRYEVVQYPKAEVEINVYTLSAEEGFIGV